MGGDSGPHKPVHPPTTDSRFGEDETGNGAVLHHVIDLDWMKEAYRLTRKDGAPGIDGVTAADYEVNLEAKLLDLLDRIKSGRYHAPPVRRAYIQGGWLTKAARHSNLRRQGGATRRDY